ncbi:hypothetical protein G6F57_018843 [Rhizopus arrhizus]|nr:hypothetical protein G6F57_018843 [Rhizopus arrhizus]
MVDVGLENLDLVKYLVNQARLTDEDRHAQLQKYFPQAKREDWRLVTAGERVQVIKRDPEKGPILQFGTEVVTDKDNTIAALLGASPGASTSPPIMLNLLAKAFPQQMEAGWKERLKEIIPSYGQKLNDSPALTNQIRAMTSQTLHLPYVEVPVTDNATANTGVPAVNPPAAPNPAAAQPARNANTEMQAL